MLDPFAMQPVDRARCEHWLRDNGLDVTAAFEEASAVEITLRMLNNLSGLARAAEDPARALEITDYKLALENYIRALPNATVTVLDYPVVPRPQPLGSGDRMVPTS